MIPNLKTPAQSSDSLLYNTKQHNTKKNIQVLTPEEIQTLISKSICPQCYKKDPMIYPESSFNLCIPCDKKLYIANNRPIQLSIKNKTEDQLISEGRCPKCYTKDSILYSGSVFRTCILCDATESLRVTPKNNKEQ